MDEHLRARLLTEMARILDELGPFKGDAPRSDKWRTTEQLAHALLERSGRFFRLDDLESVLEQHEQESLAKLAAGDKTPAVIRRAKYPDRTRAMPLWGSAKHLGQPFPEQAPALRSDEPNDMPADLRVDAAAPRIFLSHAAHDRELVFRIARNLAQMGIGSWLFETHVDYRGSIADCVRGAIARAVTSAKIPDVFRAASEHAR